MQLLQVLEVQKLKFGLEKPRFKCTLTTIIRSSL